jgi:hypothetical protein
MGCIYIKGTDDITAMHLSFNTDDITRYWYDYIQQSAPLMIAKIYVVKNCSRFIKISIIINIIIM